MQFIKNLFGKDNTIIGLSGIRKQREYVRITIPENYKTTFITRPTANYLLF